MKAKIDKHKLIELAREWEAIWEARPFDNSNGLACQGAFALYYFLKEMNPAPELVVECGTWRGFSTWVIQKAVPNAKIVCSDPILASRQFLNQSVFTPEYRTREAEYTWQDFSNIDIHIPEGKRDRAVVFFDDHQNKLPRLKQAIEKGFKHIIYDDNVPYKYTHTSFEYLFNVEKDARAKKYFSRYEIFPPIYSAKHKSGVNLEGVLEKDGFYSNCFFEGKEAYSWVTKVEVTDIWPKLETRLHFDSENRVRKTLDQKHPRTKFSSIQDVMAYLENVPLKKKLANHTLPGELVVSLTSYKARFDNLHLTLRSLLLQEMWPDHIILWIAEEEKGALPPSVLELKKYGLSIRFCEDIRSYKKIVPTLREHPDSFIVTADDDIYYEPNWLKGLIESWDSEYKSVMAHRAHKIRLDEKGHPLPYKQWKWQVGPEEPADGLIVPTGCAGVLYPLGFFIKTWLTKVSLCSYAQALMIFGCIGWLY
ncbi:hypothetical protein [Halomonas sp. E19]|uniref:hypothetical protein n=1 Tax=Halomonas sp. E19 TaxID=3397247 RepID=UPI004033FC6E